MSAYFEDAARDLLSPADLEALTFVRGLLTELRPAAVDPGDTWVRRDKDGVDLVIPHRDLEGFALVVATLPDDLVVHYASYESRNRSDDFDVAMAQGPSATIRRTDVPGPAATDVVQEWLTRPLALEPTSRRRLPWQKATHQVRLVVDGQAAGDPLWIGDVAGLTPGTGEPPNELVTFSFVRTY